MQMLTWGFWDIKISVCNHFHATAVSICNFLYTLKFNLDVLLSKSVWSSLFTVELDLVSYSINCLKYHLAQINNYNIQLCPNFQPEVEKEINVTLSLIEQKRLEKATSNHCLSNKPQYGIQIRGRYRAKDRGLLSWSTNSQLVHFINLQPCA